MEKFRFSLGDTIIHYTNSPIFFEFISDMSINLPAWFSPEFIKKEQAIELGTKYHDFPKSFNRGLRYQIIKEPNFKYISNLSEEFDFLVKQNVLPSSLLNYKGRSSIVDRFPKFTNKIVEYYKNCGYNGICEIYLDSNFYSVCLFENIVNLVRIVNFSDFYFDMILKIYQKDTNMRTIQSKYQSLYINYITENMIYRLKENLENLKIKNLIQDNPNKNLSYWKFYNQELIEMIFLL